MQIRKVSTDEMSAVKDLVSDVFMEFEAPDYTKEGVTSFVDTVINNDEFINSLTIYGAFDNNVLMGIIATRNKGKHIALFFVDGNQHRKGIGRKLFNCIVECCDSSEITVNSSPYAKAVYHRLGFQTTGTEQTVMGIRFIPMVFKK